MVAGRRGRRQTTEEFRQQYTARAGIELTNEHGMHIIKQSAVLDYGDAGILGKPRPSCSMFWQQRRSTLSG